MPRVIHVYSSNPGYQTEKTIAAIVENLRNDFQFESFSVNSAGTFLSSIRASLSLHPKKSDDLIVHAWGAAALKATLLARLQPIVYSPDPETVPQMDFWLRRALCFRQTRIVCPNSAMRDHLISRGAPRGHCSTILPILDKKTLCKFPDPALRANLGFQPSDVVILAPGESTRWAEHRIAVWAVSILHVLDKRFRLLAWGRRAQSASLLRFAQRLQQPQLVVLAEPKLGRKIDFDDLTIAADFALDSSKGGCSLPSLTCLAHGIPTISAHTAAISEVAMDFPNLTLISEATPKRLAQALWGLHQAPESPQPQDPNSSLRQGKCQSYNLIPQWKTLYLATLSTTISPINLIDTSVPVPVS
jgi:hypothetical protein